jgi:16S rRNA (guanine1207-N2)-methyltransferase
MGHVQEPRTVEHEECADEGEQRADHAQERATSKVGDGGHDAKLHDMTASRSAPTDTGYRDWQRGSVKVAGTSVIVATKPGVFSHGRLDPAALLLAEHVNVTPGDVVVNMNCGNGMFGAVAATAGHAGRVLLTDRNVLSVEAATRTLAANGARNAELYLAQGASALPADVEADVVAIRIPTERLALLQLLWDASRLLKSGGRCYLAGATNEGMKSAASTLERLFGNVRLLGKDSRHRVVVATKRAVTPAIPSDLESPYLDPETFHQLDAILRGRQFRLSSRPGVFSWDHLDEATAILVEAMTVHPGESVLDIGCGCGALGIVAATLSGTGQVCMLDADVEAVRSATRSAAAAGLTNVRVTTSDVAAAVLDERFDVVVTNPPFHVGKATDLNVPLQFIHDAWQVLVPGGCLYLVANRTLPYERSIKHRFGNIDTLHDGQRFKVLSAVKEEGAQLDVLSSAIP